MHIYNVCTYIINYFIIYITIYIYYPGEREIYIYNEEKKDTE